MYASVHGVAKDLYSAAFGEEEIQKEEPHLDGKNFLPKRLSQKNLSSMDLTSLQDNELGMGVWRSTHYHPDDMAQLISSSKDTSEKGRSRSSSVLHVSQLLIPVPYLEEKETRYENIRAIIKTYNDRDLFDDKNDNDDNNSESKIEEKNSHNEQKTDYKNEHKSEYKSESPMKMPAPATHFLPPTWDPQSVFCYPVADLPVVRLVPDNLEIRHFTDVKHIADGSNANIFLARLSDELVIIKMIREEVQTDPVAVHEFDVEHGILVRIDHPHIIKILGAGRIPRRFVVLEYLGSGSLNFILCNNLLKPGITSRVFHSPTFKFINLLDKAKDLAGAMDYLHCRIHKGATILHRDLKPDNVGFTKDGSLKLFDFGLCTVVRERQGSSRGYEMTGNTGSLRYMAPEVALRRIYSEKVDVYSFGIMLWQMATDTIPFQGLSRDDFMKQVVHGGQRPLIRNSWPAAFSNMLKACWDRDPDVRPSFKAILVILQKLRGIRHSHS